MASPPSSDMQAFLVGMIYGDLLKWSSDYRRGAGIIKITEVTPEIDDQGNYLNVINVHLQSGIVLQVRVDALTQIDEEPDLND